jgi:hypothetical protein
MTWIVGAPFPFGYVIGWADIRVTFRDGREEGCLQKIYQVGPVVCTTGGVWLDLTANQIQSCRCLWWTCYPNRNLYKLNAGSP